MLPIGETVADGEDVFGLANSQMSTGGGDDDEYDLAAQRPVERKLSLLQRSRGQAQGSTSWDSRSFMSQRVDSSISKRYEIEVGAIGEGGYGKIYIGKDQRFKDRRVAIKKVLKGDEEKTAAFRKEVQIMQELDHPSICRLFETYEELRWMYFVIEYCEGGDLFDRFQEYGQLAEDTVAGILKQVVSALKYAHGRGIAHRDMKLENICFCNKDDPEKLPCNHIKVIDWGLGKYFDQARMKSNVGTATYAAPEVLDGQGDEGYTSACDLWSLGVVAYITLSGKPPFWGGMTEQLRRMRAEHYPLDTAFWKTVTPEAKDFIQCLLKQHPADRLSVDAVLAHPWLAMRSRTVAPQEIAHVLTNIEHFSRAPDFLSLCVASVARQLDHGTLTGIRDVFIQLDTDQDGVLELEEMRAGFLQVFGDQFSSADIDEIFAHLDLDGTGQISYTEWCAAGLGEESYNEEHVLWAAFKTFDVRDDGKITVEEMQKVLTRADVSQVWTADVCEDFAGEVMEEFGNGKRDIDFAEWISLMRECAVRHERSSPKRLITPSSPINANAQVRLTPAPVTRQASIAPTCCGAGLRRMLSSATHHDASPQTSPGRIRSLFSGTFVPGANVAKSARCAESTGL